LLLTFGERFVTMNIDVGFRSQTLASPYAILLVSFGDKTLATAEPIRLYIFLSFSQGFLNQNFFFNVCLVYQTEQLLTVHYKCNRLTLL